MVVYAAFNTISVISQQQLTLFMLSWVSPVLGWGSKVSSPRTLPQKKPQRIQCGSNPGPLDYKSNTLPLSHAGPLCEYEPCTCTTMFQGLTTFNMRFTPGTPMLEANTIRLHKWLSIRQHINPLPYMPILGDFQFSSK